MTARLDIDLDGLESWSLEQVGRGLTAGAHYLAGEIKGVVSQPGKGRLYGRHRASAPGDAPASDTGRLLGSIGVGDLERSPSGVRVLTVANTDYALHLELGTERMAARPFMDATLQSRAGPIFQVVKANV